MTKLFVGLQERTACDSQRLKQLMDMLIHLCRACIVVLVFVRAISA